MTVRGLGAAVAASLLAAAGVQALHQNSPPAIRLTRGAAVVHPSTRSWNYHFVFASTEDLLGTGSTGRQVFLFQLFDLDCQQGGIASGCSASPTPLSQVTSGPGDPDDPSVNTTSLVAFDADGAHGGGTGPGVGHRQIFLKNLDSGVLTRVTDADGGDSVRPSLNDSGSLLVFESTAPLLGGRTGIPQIFLYRVPTGELIQVTNGEGPSSMPMLRKAKRLVAFESTAALLGDGHDTGVSQIFWLDLRTNQLHQLTNGDGPSHHPYVTWHVRPGRAFGQKVGRGAAIFFDSSAHDLPGTRNGPGTQVYVGPSGEGDLPRVLQLTPQAVAGCSPAVLGDATYPASDPAGAHVAFIATGDLMCNGTSGRRVFVLDMKNPTALSQITGRGDVEGPIAGSVGRWFLTLATTDDMTGSGVCGHQLHLVDYFRWGAATLAGHLPIEPPAAAAAAGCDDGDACTTDSCGATGCVHTPIAGCGP